MKSVRIFPSFEASTVDLKGGQNPAPCSFLVRSAFLAILIFGYTSIGQLDAEEKLGYGFELSSVVHSIDRGVEGLESRFTTFSLEGFSYEKGEGWAGVSLRGIRVGYTAERASLVVSPKLARIVFPYTSIEAPVYLSSSGRTDLGISVGVGIGFLVGNGYLRWTLLPTSRESFLEFCMSYYPTMIDYFKPQKDHG